MTDVYRGQVLPEGRRGMSERSELIESAGCVRRVPRWLV
jgi:hypothetical protein